MRLLACHVENFGKIKDFDMDFRDGVNVISESNGWGKSTLAAFLKAMLFGLDNRREAGTDETERKAYLPWQGGRFGGELDIEVNGVRYRIRRYFGLSERMDSFKLFNLDTEQESRDFSSNIGAELFDLDRSSFMKTAYIAQNDCGTGSSDSISAKLGNLTEASEEIGGYEKAKSRIQERLNQLAPADRTGSLEHRKGFISQLQMEKDTLDSVGQKAARLQERIEEKQNQYRELIRIRSEYAKAMIDASEESRRGEMLGSYEQMKADLEERRGAMDACEQVFPNGIPSEEVFEDCQNLLRKLDEQNTLLRHLQMSGLEKNILSKRSTQFLTGIPTEENLRDMKSRATELARKQKQRNELESRVAKLERQAVRENGESYVDPNPQKSSQIPVGLVLLAFALVFTVGGLLWNPYLYAAGGILAAIGLILILSGRKANSRNAANVAHRLEARDRQMEERQKPIAELRKELEQLEAEIESGEDVIRDVLAAYPFLDRSLSYKEQIYDLQAAGREYETLLEKEKKLLDACREKEDTENRLQTFAGLLGVPYSTNLESDAASRQATAAEYAMLAEEWRKLNQRIQTFESANDLQAMQNASDCPFSLDELQGMIYEADESIELLRNSISKNVKQLEDLQQQMDHRDEKEQELAVQLDQQEKEAEEYELLELTGKYLTKAKEQYTTRYMGPITRAFAKYYEILTGQKSDAWMIDSDLSLKLREQGKMREAKWLSAGSRDLLGVCMRMAIVDAMYQEEKPFLIFDDPFVNLDDEKMENGKQLLKALGKEYQLIYFTCHESRRLTGSKF